MLLKHNLQEKLPTPFQLASKQQNKEMGLFSFKFETLDVLEQNLIRVPSVCVSVRICWKCAIKFLPEDAVLISGTDLLRKARKAFQ